MSHDFSEVPLIYAISVCISKFFFLTNKLLNHEKIVKLPYNYSRALSKHKIKKELATGQGLIQFHPVDSN